jgi:hypothetical protein
MSKLIHLWVRQALVRCMTGEPRKWIGLSARAPGHLDERAPVIEQNGRYEWGAAPNITKNLK